MIDTRPSIFAERLKTILEKPLPGWDAHSEMINYPRPQVKDLEALLPDARRGAVLVLLYPKLNSTHTVLTLRQRYNGTHSGQVSFPGGSREAHDESLWHTALREAQEEIGIIPAQVSLLGMLSQVYIPPSNFLVSPYVGFCDTCPTFTAQDAEVARIIEAPLSHIVQSTTLKEKGMYLSALQNEVKVRYFDIDNETVWGATAMMLNELKHVIGKMEQL